MLHIPPAISSQGLGASQFRAAGGRSGVIKLDGGLVGNAGGLLAGSQNVVVSVEAMLP